MVNSEPLLLCSLNAPLAEINMAGTPLSNKNREKTIDATSIDSHQLLPCDYNGSASTGLGTTTCIRNHRLLQLWPKPSHLLCCPSTCFISISKVMTSQSHAFSSSTTMSLRYLNSVMGKKFTVKIELDKTQRLTIPYFSHHRMESTCL
ncbi:unnamed protein product [Linum tenue]|uniref:Uncharacterized protein n=1 Tax=Linum tenue TaxID=586396 RepID=A0AAV0N5C1_9ROSI|nr:unnamed protein product [Linum tenue]